jgi:hypothetical protein
MMGGIRKASLCTLGCLALALLGPMLAAQTGPSASSLPDAPSASGQLPPHVAQMRNRTTLGQSWWLVVPREPPHRPLTSREKFDSFVHHSVSPYTLAAVVYDASWAQAWGDPSEFGGGMEGWGKRLGAAAAGTEVRSFFGTFLFPTLLHQDPRYFEMGHGPVFKRGLHGVKRVFVTRNDEGQDVFNTSGMLAIAFTESLGMAWTPEGKRSAGTTFIRVLGAMQVDATGYVLREFTPDILRFFNRHAPKSMQRIEQRLPSQITGDTSKR